MTHRLMTDFNKFVDGLEHNYLTEEELIEPPKESLEEYLQRKRMETISKFWFPKETNK